MLSELLLSRSHWDSMRRHVRSCLPMEACGLLAGTGNSVAQVYLITNAEASPSRFRMQPAEQLRAFSLMEARGMDLLGIFHSHPAEAVNRAVPGPSPTDIREAAYPVVHVIWSRTARSWRADGYWIGADRITPVTLKIGPPQ